MIGIYIFISFVIFQRLVELVIAKQNEKWMKARGGYEVGREHYPYIVFLHICFFLSLLIEVTFSKPTFSLLSVPVAIFLIAQLGRVWALTSLGRFWNTKIFILPGAQLIAKGPYRFIRHPNYVIVIIEIATLPLIFHAYWTAIIFTLLNALVLSVRIKVENKALRGGV